MCQFFIESKSNLLMNSVLIADRPNVTDSLTHTHTYTVLVIRTQINEILDFIHTSTFCSEF